METSQQSPDGRQPHQGWATPPRGELDRFAQARPTDSYVEVGNLLTQFHRTSPVRSIAEGLLGNLQPTGVSNLPLFSALANNTAHHWREQVVAAWAIGRVRLDAQERDAAAGMLLDVLERDTEETLWERCLQGLLWGYGTMLPLCLIWSILICVMGEGVEWADLFTKMLLVLGTFASVVAVPLCLIYGNVQNQHNDLLRAASAESLGRLRVLESVGVLAECLFDSSATVSEAAAAALLEILPQLHEEDYGAMHHQALTRMAEALHHPNTLLVFKILEALKKVGTGHTLPAVERLVRDGKTRQLQEEARQVAAVLEERRRREREARHLIRPTIAPGNMSEDLMRAALPGSSSESTQIMKVGIGSDDDWV